jgi:hypothetical protein
LAVSSLVFAASSTALPSTALPSTALPSTSLPSTAAGTGPAACFHTSPAAGPADARRLAQPTSTSDPRPLGEAIAEGVGRAIRSLEPLDETGRPASGLPYGLSQGIVGVLGTADTGYKLVIDPSAVDQPKYRRALAQHVPSAGIRLVAVERSCRSAESIAAAWIELSARGWHAEATRTTFTADLDAATEQITVEYDQQTTSTAAATALAAVDGAVVRTAPGSLQRMSRTNDTPSGGHWGGARITSSVRHCTAGFTVVRRSSGARASVTAGHCGAPGTSWNSGSHYYGTTSVRTDYPDYDQALLTGSSYGPKIWTDGPGDTEDVRTVKGGADPSVGSQICQSGSFTRSLCGITVNSNNATYCDTEGCTTHVTRGTRSGQIVVRAGDSGGPVYTKTGTDSATVRGIAFAGSGCNAADHCTTIYAERYTSITGHLGVYALTG